MKVYFVPYQVAEKIAPLSYILYALLIQIPTVTVLYTVLVRKFHL